MTTGSAPRRAPPPKPDYSFYRVQSLEDLAPEIPETRHRRMTDNNVGDSSQMSTFLAAHTGM